MPAPPSPLIAVSSFPDPPYKSLEAGTIHASVAIIGLDKFSLMLFNQKLNSSTSRGLTKQAKRWDPITSSNPG
jgi:hypothetical protein